MRISFTVCDYLNDVISDLAKSEGISKDKMVGRLVMGELMTKGLISGREKTKNERGAGRKREYSEAHRLAMRAHKINGLSYREIAKIYDCSVATVHRLINESE